MASVLSRVPGYFEAATRLRLRSSKSSAPAGRPGEEQIKVRSVVVEMVFDLNPRRTKPRNAAANTRGVGGLVVVADAERCAQAAISPLSISPLPRNALKPVASRPRDRSTANLKPS